MLGWESEALASLVTLMLVDNLSYCPLFAQSAPGPKRYSHSPKDRLTTIEEKSTTIKCYVLTVSVLWFSSHELG